MMSLKGALMLTLMIESSLNNGVEWSAKVLESGSSAKNKGNTANLGRVQIKGESAREVIAVPMVRRQGAIFLYGMTLCNRLGSILLLESAANRRDFVSEAGE